MAMRIGIFTTNYETFKNLEHFLEHEGHELVWFNPYKMPKFLRVHRVIIDPVSDHPNEIRSELDKVIKQAGEGEDNGVIYVARPQITLPELGLANVKLPIVDRNQSGCGIQQLLEKLNLQR